MYSLKIAQLVREYVEAEVIEVYRDMRTFGKDYEEFFNRTRQKGVTFYHGRVKQIQQENGHLVVRWAEGYYNEPDHVAVDMVILATALEPQADTGQVASRFGISRGRDGFFLEKHPKLDPVATTTEGVLIAGCCQGPKDIPDTVAQSSAAAARAMAIITKGSVEIEPTTAFIEEKLCSGCKTCISLCPYNAISFDEGKKVSAINEALCKGCGTCAAACPSGAIAARHFTTEQIMSELEGVLI